MEYRRGVSGRSRPINASASSCAGEKRTISTIGVGGILLQLSFIAHQRQQRSLRVRVA
jgi:hypothetical protein